jgi:hypothetical protein
VHRDEEISLGQNIVRCIPFFHRCNTLCPGYAVSRLSRKPGENKMSHFNLRKKNVEITSTG